MIVQQFWAILDQGKCNFLERELILHTKKVLATRWLSCVSLDIIRITSLALLDERRQHKRLFYSTQFSLDKRNVSIGFELSKLVDKRTTLFLQCYQLFVYNIYKVISCLFTIFIRLSAVWLHFYFSWRFFVTLVLLQLALFSNSSFTSVCTF